MNLTIQILHIELSEKLKCKVFLTDNGCGSIESPKFYEDGITALPGHCYISESIQPQEWNRDPETLFIICGEVHQEEFDNCKYSALYFSKTQSLLHVMNIVLEIFAKYNRWDESLLKLQNESSSLDALLQISLPIFNNPLFLIDSGFNVLAIAVPGLPPEFEHPDKVEDIWIIRGKDDLIKARDVPEPYYRHLPNDYPRLFINLLDGEHFLGNLSIQASHHEFREYDEYLLTHLAGVLQSVILRFGSADNKTRNLIENMLSGIIDGRVVNKEEFARVLTFVGFTAREQFQCLAIKIPKPSGNEYIRYFLQQLETRIPAVYIPTYGEIASMVLRVSIAEQQEIDVISTLQKELKSFGIQVGLSDIYDDLLFTKQYFTQARFALEASEITQNKNNIQYFSDYCMDYILENCMGNLKATMLFTEGFKRLVKHDIDGRASYIETLRAYLDNNMNANRAAATLYITRNSFLSRLERINLLLDEDMKDPKVRFRLELSLLLYDKWKEM